MKQSVRYIICILILPIDVSANSFYELNPEVNIYYGNSDHYGELIKRNIENNGVFAKRVDRLDKNSNDLYIVADAFLIPFDYFPRNYIIYQTLDFDAVPLTKSYLEKLKGAIAIWDSNNKNVSKYSLFLDNYYFFDLKNIDPLLLPCFLPKQSLASYKEVLIYSNNKDTDISSHLPAIFVHTILHQPKIVIESGVRSGESSFAFKKALENTGAQLIGIDIDNNSADVYSRLGIKNSEFKIMDDLKFHVWWNSSAYQGKKADIIFIDTSHHYDHTIKELNIFLPFLAENGLLMFHDTNMCPLDRSTYQRINNTFGKGWDNKRGVVRAIKDFFRISFDENQYLVLNFTAYESSWVLLHYPYCNGFTLIKRSK